MPKNERNDVGGQVVLTLLLEPRPLFLPPHLPSFRSVSLQDIMDRMHSEMRESYGPGNLRHVVGGNPVANDIAWEQVFKWEAMHGAGAQCGGIRLVSFAKFKANRSPSATWAVFWGSVFYLNYFSPFFLLRNQSSMTPF